MPGTPRVVLSRPVSIHHCTSEPYRFFGRTAELALLDHALDGADTSLIAFLGPGGQGKTAIVQHWLEPFRTGARRADGVFLWSFYRGKDADLFLRELYAYAEGLSGTPEVSASYCVDHLLSRARRECWALVLDGAEVVQHDAGPWFGRFVHPEVGRLLEELAGTPIPGVVTLTTRFPLPELERRRYAQLVTLGGLDRESTRGLLTSLGVRGEPAELDAAAEAAGYHAKAVELLGTYLVRFRRADVRAWRDLPSPVDAPDSSASTPQASRDEQTVLRVLGAHQEALSPEAQDILALATAFRDPPTEERLVEYLASVPVRQLLHETWGRSYLPFGVRPPGWIAEQVQELIDLRLLERVGQGGDMVIDAHPLVRRGFESVLGAGGRRQSARARAGFLHGRPDRRRPATLEEAREEVELFHAYCDAGLWNEADGAFVALDNPKHRFLAPAFERDLLLRFFPGGAWRQPPLWPGFGRYRSLAISFELLGQFEDALAAYRPTDAALRGDALIVLGRLGPLLAEVRAAQPWQVLWQAYRAHALCLAGRGAEAVELARGLVPVDVYEWVHVFECLLRAGRLAALDVHSFLYRPPHAADHRWADLARQRMRADYLRVTGAETTADLGVVYAGIIEAYDRGGLPYERALCRLSHARWLLAEGRPDEAARAGGTILELARRYHMRIVEVDGHRVAEEVARRQGRLDAAAAAARAAARLRAEIGYAGPDRP